MKESTRNLLLLSAGVFIGGVAVAKSQKKPQARTAIQKIRSADNLLPKGAVPPELIQDKGTPGVHFGKVPDEDGRYIGKSLSTDGHILVLGYSGCGKSAGIVKPTVETGGGFGVYLDIKGEISEHWQNIHGDGDRKCLSFKPYDENGCNCWYDPFAPMRHDPENLVDHATQLARTLIPENQLDQNKIWSNSAEKFLTAALLYGYEKGFTFAETLELVNIQSVSELMEDIKRDGSSCARMFISKFSDMEPRVIAGIGMELTTNLSSFSTSSAILNALAPSDGKELLDWELLNGKDEFDVILSFPEDKLLATQPLFRVMVNQLIETLERRKERSYDDNELPPVLVVADEFPRLGPVPALKTGLTTLRSRGVTMVLLVQSLASLDSVYGENVAREICENCNYKVVLGCTDGRSQQYIADLVGTTAIRRMSTNEGANVAFSMNMSLNFGRSFSEDRQQLIQPHVLQTLSDVLVIAPQGAFLFEKRLIFSERIWPREQVSDADALINMIGEFLTMRKDPEKVLAEAMEKLELKRRRKAEDDRKQEAKRQKEFNRSCFLIGKQVLTAFPELNRSGSADLERLEQMISILTENPLDAQSA